jgi:hypothetical protein
MARASDLEPEKKKLAATLPGAVATTSTCVATRAETIYASLLSVVAFSNSVNP